MSVHVLPTVPSGLITSTVLSTSNPNVTTGSSVTLTCIAKFSVDITGTMIEFDYGLLKNTVAANASTTQTDTAIISPVEISSAGEYTCTVTVTAPGVCGGGDIEPACPNKTSDPMILTVQCEL